MLREEELERGLSPRDAQAAARRTLGNEALTAQRVREVWSSPATDAFWQDVRYACRTMAANRTFSALAILSLALGIGANTAIFSFMDSILLRSLPVADPESLVILSWHTNRAENHGLNRHDDSFLGKGAGFGGSVFAYPALEMFRSNEAIFSSVCGFQGAGTLHFALGNQAELAASEFVTGDYFQSLGVAAAAGRPILTSDDQAGAASVAVISFALSRRRFGDPANAVGREVLINNLPFSVIGVAPPEFFGADPGMVADVYLPLHANLLLGNSIPSLNRINRGGKGGHPRKYDEFFSQAALERMKTRQDVNALALELGVSRKHPSLWKPTGYASRACGARAISRSKARERG